jgi:uncharacterized protein YukE
MNFRKNLYEIIKLLNQQIESVREEIKIYNQKGGRIASLFEGNQGQQSQMAENYYGDALE